MNTFKNLLLLTPWLLVATAHAGTVTYVYTDPQGTPLAEASASGTITARFDYAPYGQSVTSMGAAPNGPGYTGHVNDPDTGLVYMQARYYDPEVGRFLSVDPVGASPGLLTFFNRFAYVDNNPISGIDPFGKYKCDQNGGCPNFDNGYAKLKEAAGAYSSHSPQGKAFAAVFGYYGAKGAKNSYGNNVYIKEGATSLGNPAEIGHNALTGSDTITFDTSQFGGSVVEMAASAAHEGQHGSDDSERRLLNRRETVDTVRATEQNAYWLQSYVYQGLGVNSPYYLWRKEWSSQEVEGRRQDRIEFYREESVRIWLGQH